MKAKNHIAELPLRAILSSYFSFNLLGECVKVGFVLIIMLFTHYYSFNYSLLFPHIIPYDSDSPTNLHILYFV